MVRGLTIANLAESIAASGLPMASSDEQYYTDVMLIKRYLRDSSELTEVEMNRVKANLKRFIKLGKAKVGSGHDCAIKGVNVSFNLNKTQSFDHQLQRYNWINYVSSMSTMHRITSMDISKSCHDYVSKDIIQLLEQLKTLYLQFENNSETQIKQELNSLGIQAPEKITKKGLFEILIMKIPSGFKLTVRIDTNYLQLKTIYAQRKHHKMQEWNVFCDWIASLPLMNFILGIEEFSE